MKDIFLRSKIFFISKQCHNCADGASWLEVMLEKTCVSTSSDDMLDIPIKSDGSVYTLNDLWADQRQIMAQILFKLREWLSHLSTNDCENSTFEPVRLTIVGAAGTGKSVLINTLVTVLRSMFNDNDVVQVAAPTGTAAFNIGGETLHRLFAITIEDEFSSKVQLSEKAKKNLRIKFKNTVALLLDKRSMISLSSLGTACTNVSSCAHGGHHPLEDWGGVPIVILFGDDYQLPPPISKGAFEILVYGGPKFKNDLEALGAQQFLSCGSQVFELASVKRTRKGQKEFKTVLELSRIGQIDRITAEKLVNELSLHKNQLYTEADKELIFKDSLFISANKAPVEEYNLLRLSKLNCKEISVTLIKSRTQCRGKKGKNHIDEKFAPAACLLCAGAMVSICGRNFWPKWGLHNGALGTVIEIVFRKGESPNNGDLPLFVVVDFKAYCGPAWDPANPTVSFSWP